MVPVLGSTGNDNRLCEITYLIMLIHYPCVDYISALLWKMGILFSYIYIIKHVVKTV